MQAGAAVRQARERPQARKQHARSHCTMHAGEHRASGNAFRLHTISPNHRQIHAAPRRTALPQAHLFDPGHRRACMELRPGGPSTSRPARSAGTHFPGGVHAHTTAGSSPRPYPTTAPGRLGSQPPCFWGATAARGPGLAARPAIPPSSPPLTPPPACGRNMGVCPRPKCLPSGALYGIQPTVALRPCRRTQLPTLGAMPCAVARPGLLGPLPASPQAASHRSARVLQPSPPKTTPA